MLREPDRRPPFWKRGIEYDIKRVALSGNNLRALIVGLVFLIGFAIVIGIVFAGGEPSEAGPALTFTGVIAGGLLAVTAVFTSQYLSSSVRHAKILREDFFETVAGCKLLEDGKGNIVQVIAGTTDSAAPVGSSRNSFAGVDELELFRYAFPHFVQYPGMGRAWREVADAVNQFNAEQAKRISEIELGLRAEAIKLGLAEAVDDPDGVLKPGTFRTTDAALSISQALTHRKSGLEGWTPNIREDTGQQPSTIIFDGHPFARCSALGAPLAGPIQQLIERVAQEANLLHLFVGRAKGLAELSVKVETLRKAARLVSGHIEASNWIQGSCEIGL